MDNQTPPTNPIKNPTAVQTPPSPKSFLSAKIILLIVIVLILIASGGTYLALNSKSKPQACTQEAKICPDGISVGRTGPNCAFAPCPTKPTPTVNETANWKTYVDDELNFSIKYPPQIAIYRTLSEGGVEFVRSENKEKDLREVNMLAVYSRGAGGTNPEEVFKNSECPKPCNENIEQVELNNAMGIKTLGPGYPYAYNYYLTNKNKTARVVRLFIFPNNIDSNKDLAPFEKMFSTFKFTDSGVSPTPTCRPRPACLDATPRCLIPETSDMCPPAQK